MMHILVPTFIHLALLLSFPRGVELCSVNRIANGWEDERFSGSSPTFCIRLTCDRQHSGAAALCSFLSMHEVCSSFAALSVPVIASVSWH